MNTTHGKCLSRVFQLVETGHLPETAIERLAYCGHKLVNSFDWGIEQQAFKCVSCDSEWVGSKKHVCADPEVFRTNYLQTALWRCLKCSYDWEGPDGVQCPWCDACEHEWGSPDGEPCTHCQKDKDEWMSEIPEGQRIAGWVPGYYKSVRAEVKP